MARNHNPDIGQTPHGSVPPRNGRVLYTERTWAPLWVLVLLWTACIAGAVGAIYDLQRTAEPISTLGAGLTAVAILLFPLLITLVFTRLDVEVRTDCLRIAFGPIHLVRKRIPLSEIESVRGLTYRPLREFGGWGIKPRKGKTAWTIRGNQALRVRLRSGREVYVGSRFPQRLEERVRMAMRGAGTDD